MVCAFARATAGCAAEVVLVKRPASSDRKRAVQSRAHRLRKAHPPVIWRAGLICREKLIRSLQPDFWVALTFSHLSFCAAAILLLPAADIDRFFGTPALFFVRPRSTLSFDHLRR
jgi:hypothetical protein